MPWFQILKTRHPRETDLKQELKHKTPREFHEASMIREVCKVSGGSCSGNSNKQRYNSVHMNNIKGKEGSTVDGQDSVSRRSGDARVGADALRCGAVGLFSTLPGP